MNILHLCDSLFVGGGISSFISNLVEEQNKSHNVSVVSIYQSQNIVKLPSNITLKCLGKEQFGFSVKYPILILKYIKEAKADIVHIHSSFLYYALSIILLHHKIKFVYTIHSDAVQENAGRLDHMFLWLKKMYFRLEWIYPITISKASKKSFDELYGMDSKLIVNGIRKRIVCGTTHMLVKFRYTNNTKIFYHPGRISEAKNQLVLCESFRQLISNGQDVVLVISGTKQDQYIYKQLEPFFSDRIIYLGERSDVLELLHEADAMCLPSKWEGMPIVLLESLSIGCIPICSNVGGIPEVIEDGYNGIMSTSSETKDYVNALYRFLSLSKDDIVQMKSKALETFDRFDIEKVSSEYCNFYHFLKYGQNR